MSPALGGRFLTAEPQGKSPLTWPSSSSRSHAPHPGVSWTLSLLPSSLSSIPSALSSVPSTNKAVTRTSPPPSQLGFWLSKPMHFCRVTCPIRCSDMPRMKFLESPCDSSPQTDLFAAKASPSGLAFQRHSPPPSLLPASCHPPRASQGKGLGGAVANLQEQERGGEPVLGREP